MASQPFVSVGLPVYNAERYLAGVIESHLEQTHTNFELIISDNASTDSTPAICDDYARRDRRIRVVREPKNRGLSWNHARVLELATGPYFRWGAGDDLMSRGLIAETVALLEGDPKASLCVPHTKNIDADGAITATLPRTLDLPFDEVYERAKAVLVRPYQMVFPQGLMRRDALMSTRRRWDYFGWDFVLLLELALRGRLRQTETEFLLRRLHPNQASRVQNDARHGVTLIEPTFRARWVFPHWRWQFERFRAVSDAPIAPRERRRLYALLGHQIWWSRNMLLRDLTMNLRLAIGRTSEMPF